MSSLHHLLSPQAPPAEPTPPAAFQPAQPMMDPVLMDPSLLPPPVAPSAGPSTTPGAESSSSSAAAHPGEYALAPSYAAPYPTDVVAPVYRSLGDYPPIVHAPHGGGYGFPAGALPTGAQVGTDGVWFDPATGVRYALPADDGFDHSGEYAHDGPPVVESSKSKSRSKKKVRLPVCSPPVALHALGLTSLLSSPRRAPHLASLEPPARPPTRPRPRAGRGRLSRRRTSQPTRRLRARPRRRRARSRAHRRR